MHGPSLLWAEFAMGRDVQLPQPRTTYEWESLKKRRKDSRLKCFTKANLLIVNDHVPQNWRIVAY